MKRPTLAVLLASATAILPALVLGSIASAAEALPGEAFQLPAAGDQLVLTRELHKPRHDGSEVFTKRACAIHITPIDGGYRVDGTLIAVEVVAPAALEPIAELERKRLDTGYFPVWLDAAGMIVR